MNRQWMQDKLEQFKTLCERYDRATHSTVVTDAGPSDVIAGEMATLEPTIRQILTRITPELGRTDLEPKYTGGVYEPLRATRLALGQLRDQDEWETNLAPDAPSLIADQFHPRIWASAGALWDTGQYRVAVSQATTALSAHIAAKAGTHLRDRKLVSEVFAPAEPRSGQMRLHLPGNTDSESWQSRQAGLHLLAQGAFAGIRNIAAHEDEQWPEQVALEHLAVLSIIARWADETSVVTNP